jgi:hypothetical protein
MTAAATYRTARVERVASQLLRIECPFCHKTHWHQVGGGAFRTANCDPRDLPEELRDKPLRYKLVIPEQRW